MNNLLIVLIIAGIFVLVIIILKIYFSIKSKRHKSFGDGVCVVSVEKENGKPKRYITRCVEGNKLIFEEGFDTFEKAKEVIKGLRKYFRR